MKTIIVFSITLSLGLLFLIIAGMSVFDDDFTVDIPESVKSFSRVIFPQGWQFFTKNPRDSRLQAYSKEGSTWRKITLLESSSGLSIREIFGINRFRRAYGIEVGLILYLIPNKYKKYICKSDIMLCIDKKSVEMIKIKNTSVKPMICGEVLLVEKKVIPWAWVKFKNEEQSMFYWVDVLC